MGASLQGHGKPGPDEAFAHPGDRAGTDSAQLGHVPVGADATAREGIGFQ
jgi:hypothetical protein